MQFIQAKGYCHRIALGEKFTDTFDIGKKITELSDKFPICTKSHRYDMVNKRVNFESLEACSHCGDNNQAIEFFHLIVIARGITTKSYTLIALRQYI